MLRSWIWLGCFLCGISTAWAGTYRVEILLGDGVGFTEPQAWATAFGNARSGSIRIRQARGDESVEIRNDGTETNPELVIIGRLQADGRLRLPDGTHALSDAATLVAAFEKLAHPELVSNGNSVASEPTSGRTAGNAVENTQNSAAAPSPAPSTEAVVGRSVSLPYLAIFAQPVGFATDKMSKSEILQKIAETWQEKGLTIGGLQPILRVVQEQEAAEIEKRKQFAEVMGKISERRLAGETLDVQEELAKIYGYAPGASTKGQKGKMEVRAAIPAFETVWNSPVLEPLASGTAVAYLLRSAGFALEVQTNPVFRLEIVPLCLPAPAEQPIHPMGYELSTATFQSSWLAGKLTGKTEKTLAPKFGQKLTISRLDKVPLDSLLTNLSKKIDMPILIDYAALRAKSIVLDQKPVSLPASESTYRQTINDAIKPLQLRAVLRVDDAGKPFLWITTGFVKYP
ncbi:MAG: hypothetical protein PHE53_10025 [Thermoguttaceae bacterium]|nr:hypothetical protein [Thermoguttaceae bacterium]